MGECSYHTDDRALNITTYIIYEHAVEPLYKSHLQNWLTKEVDVQEWYINTNDRYKLAKVWKFSKTLSIFLESFRCIQNTYHENTIGLAWLRPKFAMSIYVVIQ